MQWYGLTAGIVHFGRSGQANSHFKAIVKTNSAFLEIDDLELKEISQEELNSYKFVVLAYCQTSTVPERTPIDAWQFFASKSSHKDIWLKHGKWFFCPNKQAMVHV